MFLLLPFRELEGERARAPASWPRSPSRGPISENFRCRITKRRSPRQSAMRLRQRCARLKKKYVSRKGARTVDSSRARRRRDEIKYSSDTGG